MGSLFWLGAPLAVGGAVRAATARHWAQSVNGLLVTALGAACVHGSLGEWLVAAVGLLVVAGGAAFLVSRAARLGGWGSSPAIGSSSSFSRALGSGLFLAVCVSAGVGLWGLAQPFEGPAWRVARRELPASAGAGLGLAVALGPVLGGLAALCVFLWSREGGSGAGTHPELPVDESTEAGDP